VYIDGVPTAPESLRIGEFARRVGVNAALLRAWERRYGLLQPVRSSGGFRLYSTEDAERVVRMRRGLDEGLSAAEAARAALQSPRPSDGLLEDAAARLLAAINDYDEVAVQGILDRSFAAFGLEAVLRELIIPTLNRVGAEWEQGNLAVGQEHFASNLIRARLLSLARMWGRRILFLGADTPIATLMQAAETTEPALTVLASFDPDLLERDTSALRRLAKRAPLVLSGPGASEEICARLGVRRLNGDLVRAADEIGQTTGG
jgi:MerR family transcriptional regulator, light-induced transcriptional regulator